MFELDTAILEAIIFAMENQKGASLVDALTGAVLEAGMEPATGADMVRAPVWTSGDGFKLMERFARSVSEPEAGLALRAALTHGKGVFRAFKDALDGFPEVNRLWYEYKTAAMGRRVRSWYERLKAERGLAALGNEPEDLDGLVDLEYELSCGDELPGAAQDITEACRRELSERCNPALVDYSMDNFWRLVDSAGKNAVSWCTASSAALPCAALAALVRLPRLDASAGVVPFLYVEPAHRRQGLGLRLIELMDEDRRDAGLPALCLDMPYLPAGFGRALSSRGWEPYGIRYLSGS